MACDMYNFIVHSGCTYDVTNLIKSRSRDLLFLNYFLSELVNKGIEGDFSDRDYEIINYLLYRGAEPLSYCRRANKELILLGVKDKRYYRVLDVVLNTKDERLIEIFLQFSKYLDDPFVVPPVPNYFLTHNTAVLSAVAYQSIDLVRYALKFSSHHNERSFHFNNTPLHIAASLPQVDITKYVIQYYTDLEATNIYLETPLFLSVKHIQFEQMRFLLHAGANFTTTDKDGNTLLHALFTGGRVVDIKILELLLDIGCDPNSNANGEYGTPLHTIARNHEAPHALECAKLLIRRGAIVNFPNLVGNTPLHHLTNSCGDFNPFFELFLKSDALTDHSFRTFLDILSRKLCIPTRQDILRNLILLDVSGKFEFGVNPMGKIPADVQFEKECREELQLLGIHKIAEFQTAPKYSFVGLLSSNEKQISKLCVNPNLRSIMSSFNEDEYPIYGRDLKKKFETGLRLFLEEEIACEFLTIASKGVFDYDTMKEVIKYIPLKELGKLEECLLLQPIEELDIESDDSEKLANKKKGKQERKRIEKVKISNRIKYRYKYGRCKYFSQR